MQTIQLPSLADHVRTLPAEGAGRNRQLHHVIDLHATAEAAAALQAAAARKREDAGVLGRALTSADAILGMTDRELFAQTGVSVPQGAADDGAAHDQLRDVVASPEFLALLPHCIRELREVASTRPDTGACTVATALELWLWTMKHFQAGTDKGVWATQAIDELAEALCPLLAARCLALEVGAKESRSLEDTPRGGTRSFAALHPSGVPPAQDDTLRLDLCHVYTAHASALAGATCAELVFGYRRHLVWDAEGCATCFAGDDLDELEALMPGIASGTRMSADVIEADGSHALKAGPCVRFDGVDTFMRLRNRLDGCLTGARIAKDRAAAAIARSMAASTLSKPSKGRA